MKPIQRPVFTSQRGKAEWLFEHQDQISKLDKEFLISYLGGDIGKLIDFMTNQSRSDFGSDQKIKNPEWLEDEEVSIVVSKILPHLSGLTHSQAVRVLDAVSGQVGRLAMLKVKSIQRACEELLRACSGQA